MPRQFSAWIWLLEYPCPNHNNVCVPSVYRYTRALCPNHINVCVPSVYIYQGTYAQTLFQLYTVARASMRKQCSNEPRFCCACLPMFKYGNNSWDLSGWFPKCVFGYARGSMRKVLRKHDAQGSSRGSSRGSSWRPYVRLETLFAEASRKHLPRNHCGRVCGNKVSSSADQEETSLRGSSAEARVRKGCCQIRAATTSAREW